MQRHRTRLPNAILPSGRVWSTLPTSFLTQYLLYLELEMQPPDDLCITSYFDNASLLESEEAFYTRDIDSLSWYTNSEHDVIMRLSALRTERPLRLAALHVRAHQDKKCELVLLSRPEQLNVLADRLVTYRGTQGSSGS
jgi:hypothetical protein